MNIEKNKFDLFTKKRLEEYKTFFNFIKSKRAIITFKKNLFFVRYYYSKFIKNRESIKISNKKKKFFLRKLKFISKHSKVQIQTRKIEMKRFKLILSAWKKKTMSEVLSKFIKLVKSKKNIKAFFNKKIIKLKKKFIKSLKKDNILQMIKEILEFKYNLMLKKQMFNHFIQWSIKKYTWSELTKIFNRRLFIRK